MSFGKMNTVASIGRAWTDTDEEGFSVTRVSPLEVVRVYREGRHGSVRWANLAAFSEATDLFRLRTIPDLTIVPGMYVLIGSERFEILSVEDVKGRGMYLELLAKKVVPVHG